MARASKGTTKVKATSKKGLKKSTVRLVEPADRQNKPAPTSIKRINVALQGGGSHGAFTWGVLHALLSDPRISIEGASGTSAGGMNATSLIYGLIQGGNKGAQEMLAKYWGRIGEKGRYSMLQFSPIDKAVKNFVMSSNPMYKFMNFLNGMFSPYQLNPTNIHPLREIVDELFDFKLLQTSKKHKLFLCATHVATGKLRIFSDAELTPEAMLASACVPNIFQAVEYEGQFYWDGGFIGNPAIYPLIYNCDAPDIVVIQIRAMRNDTLPTTTLDINNRLGDITQNACLVREMRAIDFITKLMDQGVIPEGKLKRIHMHLIYDDAFFAKLDHASGFSADPDFLEYLFQAGLRCGKRWISENFDSLGKKSTAKLEEHYV